MTGLERKKDRKKEHLFLNTAVTLYDKLFNETLSALYIIPFVYLQINTDASNQ